jgi:hypothetical protein
MVGEEANHAPALVQADLGVATITERSRCGSMEVSSFGPGPVWSEQVSAKKAFGSHVQ